MKQALSLVALRELCLTSMLVCQICVKHELNLSIIARPAALGFDENDCYVSFHIPGKSLCDDQLNFRSIHDYAELLKMAYSALKNWDIMQALGLTHRDLTKGNLLLDGSFIDPWLMAVIAEFNTDLPKYSIGTAPYMAPELSMKKPEAHETSDLYSLVMVIFSLLTHTPTQRGSHLYDLFYIRKTPMDREAWMDDRIAGLQRMAERFSSAGYAAFAALLEKWIDLFKAVLHRDVHGRPANFEQCMEILGNHYGAADFELLGPKCEEDENTRFREPRIDYGYVLRPLLRTEDQLMEDLRTLMHPERLQAILEKRTNPSTSDVERRGLLLELFDVARKINFCRRHCDVEYPSVADIAPNYDAGEYRPTAVTYLMQDSELLLSMSPRAVDDGKNYSPTQGGVYQGEDPLEAALWELSEELGIHPDELTVESYLGETRLDFASGRTNGDWSCGKSYLQFLMHLAERRDFELNLDEVALVAWMGSDDPRIDSMRPEKAAMTRGAFEPSL